MKRTILLFMLLAVTWWLWSGHIEAFILLLGLASVIAVVWLARNMGITDAEGAPLVQGRVFIYAVWLAKEIVKANVEVARVILDPNLPIRPRLIRIRANQKTELGRVILANSITLTPGTVSVDMQGDRIWVHALSFEGAEEDLSGDMDRRICRLEVEP